MVVIISEHKLYATFSFSTQMLWSSSCDGSVKTEDGMNGFKSTENIKFSLRRLSAARQEIVMTIIIIYYNNRVCANRNE